VLRNAKIQVAKIMQHFLLIFYTTSQPVCRLPLHSTRPEVTFLAEERHRPSTSTKLYHLVTEAHSVNNLPNVVT